MFESFFNLFRPAQVPVPVTDGAEAPLDMQKFASSCESYLAWTRQESSSAAEKKKLRAILDLMIGKKRPVVVRAVGFITGYETQKKQIDEKKLIAKLEELGIPVAGNPAFLQDEDPYKFFCKRC